MLFGDRHQDGLRQLSDGVRDDRAAHLAPLVGLREVTHGADGEQSSEDECQQVLVEDVDDVRHQQLHAEGEHPPDGSEVNLQRGAPGREVVAADVGDGDIDYLLPGQTPVGKAVERQDDADDARHQQRHDGGDGQLAVHQVLQQVAVAGDAQRRQGQGEEHHSRDADQTGLMEEVGYQGCTEEEDGIEDGAG